MHKVLITEAEEHIFMDYLQAGFRKASKDLSMIEVNLFKNAEFKHTIESKLNIFLVVYIIEQSFWGNISGTGFILLNAKANADISLIQKASSRITPTETEASKTLLQITNAMTSTCMTNLADLLKDQVDFSPPANFIRGTKKLPEDFCNEDSTYITTCTNITLNHHIKAGFLFLAWDIECLEWLKSSLNRFK